MNPNITTRRDFLKSTGTAAAALGFPTIIPARALGKDGAPPPSERIVMGGIGLGNQGGPDMGNFLGNPGVQYVAVCDVRRNVCEGAKGRVDGHYSNKDCTAYNDFRELLAREDIDAVHIATPDHWHALMVIEACRSGKDVFCQKPESKTLREGPLMVAAARNYGRVVSGGSQRVFEDYRGIVGQCWGGEFGTIKSINVNTSNISHLCNLPAEPVPDGFDWEMWLGPAPWAPYNARRCSGDFNTAENAWRAYSDYSGGDITDWGAHHFGGATYAVDVRGLQPVEVVHHEDNGHKHLAFRYPNGIVITHNKPGVGNMVVEGTPGEKRDPKPIPGYNAKGGIGADFLHCVRTRQRPFRDIEFAVNTMVVCHLGFIAYSLGRTLKWDAAKQQFDGDDEANRFLDYARREPWQV
jgi:hypothetical protein